MVACSACSTDASCKTVSLSADPCDDEMCVDSSALVLEGSEWEQSGMESLPNSFADFLSDRISCSEYSAAQAVERVANSGLVMRNRRGGVTRINISWKD